MKKSLRKRLLFLILSFVILLSALSVGMNYQNFISTTEQSSYSTRQGREILIIMRSGISLLITAIPTRISFS